MICLYFGPLTGVHGQVHVFASYSPSVQSEILKYLFIWLHQVLVVACRIFRLSFSMWNLVPRPGIKPKPPALGA